MSKNKKKAEEKKAAPKKYISTINGLGMFIEIMAIGLLVLLPCGLNLLIH